MRNTRYAIMTLVLVSAAAEARADCVDVIKTASLRGTVVKKKTEIDTEARNFCSEYAASKAQARAFNGNVSYAGIGVGAGSSKSQIEQTASKYCDASSNYAASADSFEQYVESIAPRAFESYDRCLLAQTTRVVASLPQNAIHANSLVLTVSNNNQSSLSRENIRFIPSAGIVCKWETAETTNQKQEVTLGSNGSAALSCRRKDQSREESITLVTLSRPDSNYAFLWKKYQNDLPVDELQAIRESNTQLSQSLQNAVLPFAGDRCPTGWRMASAAAGRTIVGAGAGTDLTARKPGDIGGEEAHKLTVAELASHTHTYTFTSHRNTPKHVDTSSHEFGLSDTPTATTSAGGDVPHNVMQPFIVMNYCERQS